MIYSRLFSILGLAVKWLTSIFATNQRKRDENEKVHCIFPVLHQHDYAGSACYSPSPPWRRCNLYEKRSAVRGMLPPSKLLQRTLLLWHRLHDHPFLSKNTQSGQQRLTARLRMGKYFIFRTDSQTPDLTRRNRYRARVYLFGISSRHVHYTCHRASRTSFCSCLTDSCRKQILCRHRNDATWLHNPFTNFVFQNK